MDGLAIGRIVHYVRDDGEHQAAIVTGINYGGIPEGHVFLTVFGTVLDTFDGQPQAYAFVPYDPEGAPLTWHWPEQGAPKPLFYNPDEGGAAAYAAPPPAEPLRFEAFDGLVVEIPPVNFKLYKPFYPTPEQPYPILADEPEYVYAN